MSNSTFDLLGLDTNALWEPLNFDYDTPEPIFLTIPTKFIRQQDNREIDFLVSLCHWLKISTPEPVDITTEAIDKMKEAVNLYIVNQVGNWMEIQDKKELECILLSNFKKLSGAREFLKYRKGTRQIYWEEVLRNHRKLIKTYWHILKLTD
jgi:hypothetical protein